MSRLYTRVKLQSRFQQRCLSNKEKAGWGKTHKMLAWNKLASETVKFNFAAILFYLRM